MGPIMSNTQMYMNISTGSVDTQGNWLYTDEAGRGIDPVEARELVEVIWDRITSSWIEA